MERRAVLTTRHMPYDRSKPARLSICTAETNWQRYRAIQRTAQPPSPRAPMKPSDKEACNPSESLLTEKCINRDADTVDARMGSSCKKCHTSVQMPFLHHHRQNARSKTLLFHCRTKVEIKCTPKKLQSYATPMPSLTRPSSPQPQYAAPAPRPPPSPHPHPRRPPSRVQPP
ncbi:hypothetical protein HBI81_170790 [Parastagonospora nodorum]|nr:hypothetical protein HBH52_117710 [Parastagonospora nodorum]KAH5535672.1 hypothetical protein HBI27_166280 [Parastagonospora nodorum]KAH5834779.1 hypothetical protein HBI94_011880 [Parastagonospora nodorum]KAH5840347.1 hypothetical protein HBI93_032650 [Parastagonospora nodorum]KAH5876835.1 hypothetical protein HBI90_060570 [Parastagonospora nodorum]